MGVLLFMRTYFLRYQEERRKKFKSKKQRKDASFKDFDDFKGIRITGIDTSFF